MCGLTRFVPSSSSSLLPLNVSWPLCHEKKVMLLKYIIAEIYYIDLLYEVSREREDLDVTLVLMFQVGLCLSNIQLRLQ